MTYKKQHLTISRAEALFPKAILALRKDHDLMSSTSLEDLEFWLDPKGRLHIDDAIQSSFDDVWNGREWEGSDDEYPEE